MTPIRRQYLKIKDAYQDSIVLFRMGDFYETFDDDAQLVARELDITLTSRNLGKNLRVPMAGVPAHSLDSYLVRLVRKGHQVAICEQLSDPATSKRPGGPGRGKGGDAGNGVRGLTAGPAGEQLPGRRGC